MTAFVNTPFGAERSTRRRMLYSPSSRPLAPSVLMSKVPPPTDLALRPGQTALDIEPLRPEQNLAKFDLTLNLMESPEGLEASWEYNTDLFREESVRCMAEHYGRILQAII